MPNFTPKRGAVGWPTPQTNQIKRWCERYSLVVLEHEAQTGTRYLTITAGDDSITVRVADHADAHATADYTVDPTIDQRASVKAWIIAHGTKPERKSYSLYNEAVRRGVLWTLADGEFWHPVARDTELQRITETLAAIDADSGLYERAREKFEAWKNGKK